MTAFLAKPIAKYGLPAGEQIDLVHVTERGYTFRHGDQAGFVRHDELQVIETGHFGDSSRQQD